MSKLHSDLETAQTHGDDPMTLGGRHYSHEDLAAVLGRRLDSLPKHAKETTRVPLGTYRGLNFGIVLHPQLPAEVYLEGTSTRQVGLSRDHQGPRAVLNALERLTNGYAAECVRAERDLGIAQSQLRDYQDRLGSRFPHEAYLTDLTALRDRLKAGLSGPTQEHVGAESPNATDLANAIKMLRLTNNVEAPQERLGQRHATAEEPITVRIRNRVASTMGAACADGSGATLTDPLADESEQTEQKYALAESESFQERLACERQRRDREPIVR